MRRTPRVWGLVLVTVLAVVAAACSDDDTTTATSSGGSGAPAAGACPTGTVTDPGGSITISGSSTVAPITTRAADCFNEAGAGTAITVDGPGTGDGFKLFCEGDLDIADASRKIKAEE